MKTTNNKTRGIGLTFLILLLGFTILTGTNFASAAVTYTDSGIYSISHTYNNADSVIGYVALQGRALATKEYIYATFNYLDGSSYTTQGQEVAYLSWVVYNFVNPNPSLTVASITVTGGSHVYFKTLSAYDNIVSEVNGQTSCPTDVKKCADGSYVGRNPELDCGFNPCPGELVCGDSKISEGETCDNGQDNGKVCSAAYGSSCTYCSNSCKITTVKGEYCGDGILNEVFEKCDDGNRIDEDKCTNECKKQFEVTVEDFEPIVWQCDSRIVYDDATEPGRVSMDGQPMVERMNNYAFEGEQIKWRVLVMDKNGIDRVKEVYASVGGNMEANCDRLDGYDYTQNNVGEISLFNSVGGSISLEDSGETTETETINPNRIDSSCNARILEEEITTFNPKTMAYYECTLTVETFESMQGEQDVLVEAMDSDGVIGVMDEAEYWFFNPVIELSIDGELMFDEVRPGTSAYSTRILLGNDAEYGSGVALDMFISGTDFYDLSSSGAKCPTTNQLKLNSFGYYATNGAYSTLNDMQNGRICDAEGYCQINYGIGFNDPQRFYDRNEIIQANYMNGYYASNILYPGSEMSLILRLNLPEPCNGDFDDGQIYFWGEAI